MRPQEIPSILVSLLLTAAVPAWSQSIQTDGNIETDGQLVSNATHPTAPLIVNSTGVVSNLNADFLDGKEAFDFALDADLQSAEAMLVALQALVDALACEGCASDGLNRYQDQGDGTVLDRNTNKMWLKDADCLCFGTYSFGAGGCGLALNNLNAGVDLGCADYTPGTHSDWALPSITDLCGGHASSCEGLDCCDPSLGLVDNSIFGSPTVASKGGDVAWTPENAFVGVVDHWYHASGNFCPHLGAGVVGGCNISTLSARLWPVRTP